MASSRHLNQQGAHAWSGERNSIVAPRSEWAGEMPASALDTVVILAPGLFSGSAPYLGASVDKMSTMGSESSSTTSACTPSFAVKRCSSSWWALASLLRTDGAGTRREEKEDSLIGSWSWGGRSSQALTLMGQGTSLCGLPLYSEVGALDTNGGPLDRETSEPSESSSGPCIWW